MNKINPKLVQFINFFVAIFLSVGGRFVCEKASIPFIGDQLGVLAYAYTYGPLWGFILAIIVGAITVLWNIDNVLYILPIAAAAITMGFISKKEKLLKNFYHTITAICILGFTEGIVLAVVEAIVLKDHTLISVSEYAFEFLTLYNFPTPFKFFISSLLTVYIDVTLAIFVCWLFHFFRLPFKKKVARKRYLKRNMASSMALIFALGALPLIPSDNSYAEEQVNLLSKVYSSGSGLLGGTANDIVQTSDGTMWVATYEGLYRFNGEKFELISDIPNVRSVMCLFIDTNRNMWIGNNGTGLAVTTPNREVISCDSTNGLPSDNVREIAQADSTHYYVATSKGLAYVECDGSSISVKSVLCQNSYINGVSVAPNGLAVAYDNAGKLYFISENVITAVQNYNSGYITCIAFDDESNLYIGLDDNYIQVYENNEDKYLFSQNISTESLSSIKDMYFDENGYIYIAAGNGLGFADKDYSINVIHVEGFDSSVNHILKDYQGNLWFTSTRCGLLSLINSGFYDVFSSYGISECVVNSSTFWNGDIYVGTDNGLYILDPDTNTCIENELTLKFDESTRVRCVTADSDNNLWICDYGTGLTEVKESGEIHNYTSEDDFTLGNKVRFVKELSDGSILASTINGIAIIEDDKVVSKYLCGIDMGSAYILSVSEREDGTILAGSDGEGIMVLKDGECQKILTRADGLSSGVILRIVKDPFGDGEFVLTGSGLCYLNEDYSAYEITGFPCFNNLDMWIADDGTVVFLSSTGIYVLTYDSLMSDNVTATLIDTSNGLPSSITSNSWNYMTEDGKLYYSGNRGLFYMDIRNYGVKVDTYKPIVSAVTLDNELLVTSNSNTIDIPAGTSNIAFTMEINNFTSTDPYVRYYLSGIDDSKNVCLSSELPEATYSNIPYGNYKFNIEVLADDGETVVSKNSYNIVKEKEPYEATGFLVYFYVTFTWVLVTLVSGISNIATNASSKRQKAEYEKTLNKLEKEKAVALESALHNEEKANKSKSDFLASMSHEIRTPINAIIGMDTMILRETTQVSVKKYANDVKTASETLLALINDILDFSKIESGKMELVPGDYDVSSLFNDLINMIRPKAKSKGLELNVNISPDIPSCLYGDDVRIKQIILNILNNSVKYTEKGHIDFTVDSQPATMGDVALSVRISDTGIGIKEEDLKKLFSPYERIEEGRNKKIEGTGLGMSITKTLLELMNSKLCVESVYGQGSTFSFTILQQAKSVEKIGNFEEALSRIETKDSDLETYHAPDAKILVVDDVEMNLIVATSLLKRLECSIETASSGRDAINLCNENLYDIILLDSMMPDLSGEETLRIIRRECEINKDTPIIALTANAIKGAREEYLQEGFDNYLSKPIDGARLEAMIQCYLPDNKIIPVIHNQEEVKVNDEKEDITGDANPNKDLLIKLSQVRGIELERGIETAGGEDIYLVVCKNFYDTAPERIELLEKHFKDRDFENYTIQVHALKSSARLIGAYHLSDKAWEMEQAGRASDIELIMEKTDNVISEYRRLLLELDEVYSSISSDEDSKEAISKEDLCSSLRELNELLEAFDFDTAKELFDTFEDYKLPDDFKDSYKKMKSAFAEVDRDTILGFIKNYNGDN